MKSARPLILGTGVPEHVLDPVEHEASRELIENRAPAYICVEGTYGRKKRQ